MALEQRSHFVFCCSEWQIPNVDRRHSTNLTSMLRHPPRTIARNRASGGLPYGPCRERTYRPTVRQGIIVGKRKIWRIYRGNALPSFDLEIRITVEFLFVEA